MKRKDALFLALLAITALILAVAQSRLQAAGHGTLKVTATYTGKGVVDEQHRIYVLLMDANPFTSTAMVDATSQPIPPIAEVNVAHVLAVQGTTDRNGTLTFHDALAPTVYVVVLFDKHGEYNGHVGLVFARRAYGYLRHSAGQTGGRHGRVQKARTDHLSVRRLQDYTVI